MRKHFKQIGTNAMRLSTLIASAALLLGLGLLAGCGQGQGAAGQGAGGEPEVTVLTLAPQTLTLTTELTGRTSAFLMSEVRPQVGGIIQKRLFKEGGEVRAGETLYQIDPAPFLAAYENAKAALARAEANALPAGLKAERYAGLSKVRAVSKQDNDEAQAAHKQAQAEMAAAKAALETARINLAYTRVAAPISGRIGKSSVTPGALVTASQPTPLATIQQTDQIYVDVTQSSAAVLRMKRDLAEGRLRKGQDGGAKVSLFYEDGTPYPLEGTLQFADITVDQGTGAVNLRAVFPNPGRDLLPGLFVRAVLAEGVKEGALLVPQNAVTRDPKGGAMVLLVNQGGVVEVRPVQVSRAQGGSWIVDSGLAPGDRVIVEGLQKVRPGAKVKATEAGAPAPVAGPAPAPAANATAAPAAEVKPAAAPEAKPVPAPEAKPAAPAEAKPAATPPPAPAAAPMAQSGARPVPRPAASPSQGGAVAAPAAKPSAVPQAAPEAKPAPAPEAKPAPAPAASGAPAAAPGTGDGGQAQAWKTRVYSPSRDQWPVSALPGADTAPAREEAR